MLCYEYLYMFIRFIFMFVLKLYIASDGTAIPQLFLTEIKVNIYMRKFITLWDYFWFFSANGQKHLKILIFRGFFYLINNSKLDFFRKPSLNHLDFNCSKFSFVSIFIIYILLASVFFFQLYIASRSV